jgi:hypothetical protein
MIQDFASVNTASGSQFFFIDVIKYRHLYRLLKQHEVVFTDAKFAIYDP